jgi:hypothetical protein
MPSLPLAGLSRTFLGQSASPAAPFLVSSDPIADLCRMPIHSRDYRSQEEDPMLQESLNSWTAAATQPSYSTECGDDTSASPVYEPVYALGTSMRSPRQRTKRCASNRESS